MTKKNDNTAEGCLAFILGLLFLLPMAAFGGLVISQLWGWFVSPVTGWPEIGVWEAAGISCLVNLLIFDTDSLFREDDKSPLMKLMTRMIGNSFLLLISWGAGFLYYSLAT